MDKFLNIEIKDKRKARIYTGIIMTIFFLILIFYPFLSYQNPPPGQEGLLVSFGEIDSGQGSEAPPSATTPEKKEKTKSPPKKEPSSKPEPKIEKTNIAKAKPKEVKTPIDKKVIAANNQEIALQKQKEAKKKQRAQADAKAKADQEAKVRLAAEERAQRKKEEEARIAAQAEKERKVEEARLAAAKKSQETEDFKNALSSSFGKGRGDTDKPGGQGNPNGDPNADALKGISTGAGVIGGGLAGRGGNGPGITDNSNKTGKVVIYVCIDSNGKVTSARYTQKGSTTSDADLLKLAVDNANKWSFDSGITDSTCGTITYDFKVK